jgi:DNA-binding IclR family transcriptional regulator
VASPEHLTREAERLLAAHIDSVGTLDLLLLLHAQRDRDWSAVELCESLRCPDAWAVEQISRLRAVGLVTEGPDGRYRYVHGREYGACVDAVARACRTDRASVTRRIFAGPAGSQLVD